MNKMLETIKPIIDKFKIDGITGMLIHGSYSRNENLPYSDVDLGIICESNQIQSKLRNDEHYIYTFKDLLVEPKFYSFSDLKAAPLPVDYGEVEEKEIFWSEANRFNFEHSKIIYDPMNDIQKLFDEKVTYPESEKKLNIYYLTYEIELALNYKLPRLIKAERLIDSQAIMNSLIRDVVHLLYAKKQRFLPFDKDMSFWFKKGIFSNTKYLEALYENSAPKLKETNKRILSFWTFCENYKLSITKRSIIEEVENFGAKAFLV